MKRNLILIILLYLPIFSYGQSSVEEILKEIERNNPELQALSAEVEAERIANRSETLLDNPEVEFNYLWGAENIGGRHDLRVSQAFDFATLSGLKSGKAATMDELSGLKYRIQRREILLEARRACIDLVYYNALLSELNTHLTQSGTLVTAYEKRMAAGDATVLDLNKARIHFTSVQGQVKSAETQKQILLSRLRSLNGGETLPFESSYYDLSESIPDNFEAWFTRSASDNPMLEYVRKEVELSKKQLSIDRTSRLPELAVGYMSEIRTAEKFRGVTLGVNIPLWSGANKVRQSRAQVAAAESRMAAAEQQFYYRLQEQFTEASAMKENSEMMRASLEKTDNRDFLLSALTKGEISMIDYLVETDLYYETLEQTLEAERDYRHALATLTSFSL